MSDEDNKMMSEEAEDKSVDKEISEIEIESQADDQAENQTVRAGDKVPRKSGSGRAFGFILLLLICGLAVGGYAIWIELQKTKSELAEVTNSSQTQVDSMTGNLATVDHAIRQLESKQVEQAEALTSLYRDMQKQGSNEDWAIAEIEYLLIIAMQRLLLEEDVTTALATMEAADLRLKNMGNPDLLLVRKQLVSDMNQLRSVNLADTVGMAIYLADMVDLSADLPLKREVIVETMDSSSTNTSDNEPVVDPLWKRIPKILWQEIRSLVVIKRSDEVKQALLLPSEEYFLYQNLRLELESARQAVLRSDSQNLRSSINLILPWMRQYFNTSDSAVVNVMETLDKMRSIELKPDLPDVSSSLESLRAYIREKSSDSSATDDTQ